MGLSPFHYGPANSTAIVDPSCGVAQKTRRRREIEPIEAKLFASVRTIYRLHGFPDKRSRCAKNSFAIGMR